VHLVLQRDLPAQSNFFGVALNIFWREEGFLKKCSNENLLIIAGAI
jgi:hypothetical protein